MASGDITLLLTGLSEKQGKAREEVYDRLVALVYTDLRNRAQQQTRGEREWQNLQPTVLVHEAYEHMLGYGMSFADRGHFLNVAATAMRRFLIDRARSVKAAKRGSVQAESSISEASVVQVLTDGPDILIDLDSALNDLRADQIQLFELRFFAGFTLEEIAAIMGIRPETVKKRWAVVKTLLFDKLRSRGDTEAISVKADLDIHFDPAFEPTEVKDLLIALADYYRACGGAGFELDLKAQELTVKEPGHA